jgi:hypothetical protein
LFLVCPPGWQEYNSSCYIGQKYNISLSFQAAEDNCRTLDPSSNLPSVHSLGELSLIVDQARMLGNSFLSKKGVLLGGKIVDGKIKWTDGSPTDFTFWEDGYPPVNHRECLAVFRQLRWRDVKCQDDGQELETLFVCQLSIKIGQGKPNHSITIIIIILAMVLLFLTLVFSIKFFQNLLLKHHS